MTRSTPDCVTAGRSSQVRSSSRSGWRVRRFLLLRLELAVVRRDERPDLVGHVEQLRPLLLVERHGKSSEPVDREATLLADLERYPTRRTLLQRRVLLPQPLELRSHFIVRHRLSL